MKLELSHEERDKLIRIIDSYSSDLRVEIRRTDNYELRGKLKQEKELVAGLLERIKLEPADETPPHD